MALKTIETRAVISAQDKTGATFAQVAQKLRSMQTATENASRRVNGMTARASAASESRAGGLIAGGKALVAGAAAYGAGRMISQSVEDWADLEMAVTRLGNTGEVTDGKIKATIADFRQLGPQMGVSAKQVAQAAEVYVAAGIDFDKAIAGTPAALKAAKASGAELNDIVGAGVASMNNLGISVDKLDSAFDIMAKGGKLGSFELKNMAKELPSVASRAKNLGIQGEDGLSKIVAMLETTRKSAATGEEAANNLLNFFDKIVSQDTSKHFKKMGVDLEKELKNGAKKGKDYVETTLALVEKLTGGDAFKISQLFPDRQAREGIMALLRFKSEYGDMLRTLRTSSIGTNTRDFDRAMETSRAKLDRLSSSFEVLKTRLGERIGVPMFQPIIDGINQVLAKTDEFEAKQKRGEVYADTAGQRKFNTIMNRAAGGGMAGSNQSAFDPSVERAARDKAVRDLEDVFSERIDKLRAKSDELKGTIASTPFFGTKAASQIELGKVNAELDELAPKLENLRRLREEVTGLMTQAAPVDAALARFRGLAINQPVAESTGGPSKLAFPLSRGYGGVNPGLLGGGNPSLTSQKPEPVTVQLDPASKVDVRVNWEVKPGSALIDLVNTAKEAVAAGNARASVGTVGKTGVGSQGD